MKRQDPLPVMRLCLAMFTVTALFVAIGLAA